VTVGEGAYRVEGDAASEGWLEGMTRWRNRFRAEGVVADAGRQPRRFRYAETDGDKDRRVSVREGVLRVVKNGKARAARPAPAGADVLSALFVRPACLPEQQVHTGRHLYRLTRLEATEDSCRYRVVDDDDDAFEVGIDLVRRKGLTVPGRITFHGWVSGSIELTADES
jgi:hypothetical protein